MIDERTIKGWITEAQLRRQIPTVEVVRAIGRNEAQRAVINGLPQYTLQTTDATPTAIVTIPIDDYFGGKLRVEIIGVEDTGSGGSLAAEQVVKFWKDTALTIGTPADVLSLDTDIAGATFSINNVSDNIEITVTGIAATVINWICRYEIIQTTATNLP